MSTIKDEPTATSGPTTTKTTDLTAPISLKGEEVPAAFEKNVQKTYGRYPLTIVSGKGCTLQSSSSSSQQPKTYLDFVSGIATCILGHSNPILINAITNQMKLLHHISNLYYIPPQAELAKWLCDNSIAEKVFFCNSGAEANESAIKLVRKYANTQRQITDPVIITAEQSFHGRTLAALSATAQPKYHKGFTYGGEMVQGFSYVPYNDINALKQAVKKAQTTSLWKRLRGRKSGLAAIMLETLQGEGGIIPGNKDYFHEVRRLCDETGALLICDEVQVGMGRTGTLWGYEQLNIKPDIFTSAKALGGGIPIGAMMARGKAANVFNPGDHASTYGGNPLACAAGLAVAKSIVDLDLLSNVHNRSKQLRLGLNEIATKYPDIICEIRGWGLLLGAVLTTSTKTSCTASDLVNDAMNEGLLSVPAGPNVVRFVPPLIVTEKEVNEALMKFEKAVAFRSGGQSYSI